MPGPPSSSWISTVSLEVSLTPGVSVDQTNLSLSLSLSISLSLSSRSITYLNMSTDDRKAVNAEWQFDGSRVESRFRIQVRHRVSVMMSASWRRFIQEM